MNFSCKRKKRLCFVRERDIYILPRDEANREGFIFTGKEEK